MVSAANESHSAESLNAIAAELRGFEKNLIQLANTSIDGNYLFSGSAINTKPIDVNGDYRGNAEDLKTFLGSGVQQTYNISGQNLFLGDENDTYRKITLNMPQLNQTQLYPDVMIDPSIPRNARKEEYITVFDTIRDLMGDTDSIVDNGVLQHHFYIQGRDHDGIPFKEIVSMSDDESVADLLTRIGGAFGNTPLNQLVSVTLNKTGQIEIEDNRNGSSKLDFTMVANTDPAGPTTNLEDLNDNLTFVKSFMQSDYTEFIDTVGQRRDLYDTDNLSLASSFIRTDTHEKATGSTLLADVLRADIIATSGSIDFTGTDANGVVVATSLPVTSTTTMNDLLVALDNAYDPSGVVDFSIKNGKIVFGGQTGTTALIDVRLSTSDGLGNPIDALPSDATVSFDQAQFFKSGNKLSGNVAQIVASDNTNANLQTRLIDVAGLATLDARTLSFEGTNVTGQAFSATINLFDAGSTFTVTAPAGSAGTYNIYNTGQIPTQPISTANPQLPVAAGEITYKQLTDVMNMIIADQMPVDGTTNGVAIDYNDAVIRAERTSVTTLNSTGQIVFEQLGVTDTAASFYLADLDASNNFVDQDLVTPGFQGIASFLTFQSNNALEISDPKTNFFKQIDDAIKSVELGRKRANGDLSDPRNVGIQNAIQALDDLSEHLYNQHSVAGVQSQTLQTTADRTDLLIITTKTLRSETLDVDIAEASLELKQLELNYQAMLSSVSRITQLSLVNYL